MLIAGVDEVGRGCLAGPVVACAVVLPEGFSDKRIKDSKKLSRRAREMLYPYILENALGFGVGVVCNRLIDRINILNASKQAMHIALSRLSPCYDKIIIDAVGLKNLSGAEEHPIKADDHFIEVSAASIVAKVYRDRLMDYLSTVWQGYGWEKNAGYGTASHIEAIRRLGLTPIHRRSFCVKGL